MHNRPKHLSDPLEFTGERFTPECEREIRYEHFHRYALASHWCAQTKVLDAACGEGYGAALLAQSALTVSGVDLSEKTVNHARRRYALQDNLGFQVADCTSLPFADDEFDRVVSFETLEHLSAHDEMLREFRRVLKADGVLILSSPDKAVYSDQQNHANVFHEKELYRDELETLISRHFPACHLLGQKLMFHSAIWSLKHVGHVLLDQLAMGELSRPGGVVQPPMYFIALCAADAACLPVVSGQLYLFDDLDETVYQHYHGEIKRNMAAGGIIASLEKEISELKTQLGSGQVSWWQRLLRKS